MSPRPEILIRTDGRLRNNALSRMGDGASGPDKEVSARDQADPEASEVWAREVEDQAKPDFVLFSSRRYLHFDSV